MSNEITFYEKIDNPLEAIKTLGDYIAKSGLFSCNKPEQGAIMAMACLVENKNPLDVARTYHIVNGTLTKKYEVMIAEFYANGGKITWITRNNDEVEAKFSNKNGDMQLKVTMEELKEKGVAMQGKNMKDTYKTYPRQMLTARLVSEVINILDPAITSGLYTPEEVSDFGGTNSPKEQKPLLSQPEKTEEVIKEVEAVPSSQDKQDDAPEPTDAIVVGEFTPEQKKRLKTAHKEVNEYLLGLGWIKGVQTYLDLKSAHRETIISRFDAFMVKVAEKGAK